MNEGIYPSFAQISKNSPILYASPDGSLALISPEKINKTPTKIRMTVRAIVRDLFWCDIDFNLTTNIVVEHLKRSKRNVNR